MSRSTTSTGGEEAALDGRLRELTADLTNKDNHREIEYYLHLCQLASEPTRFAILYTLSKNNGMSAKSLGEIIGKSGNGLHQHLNKLVDAELVANWKKNDPEQHGSYSYYETTGMGEVALESITSILEQEQEAADHFRD